MFPISIKLSKYKNDKVYGNYAPTPKLTSKDITAPYAKLNAKVFLKQYNDSIKIIGTTTNPLTFFYRYDFATKRIIAVAYMREYIKMSGDSPSYIAEQLIDNKQKFIKQFIDRAAVALETKLLKLKTNASKEKNVLSFQNMLEPYKDEVSSDNMKYLEKTASRIRSRYIV